MASKPLNLIDLPSDTIDEILDEIEEDEKKQSTQDNVDLSIFTNKEECDCNWNGDGSILAYCPSVARLVAALDFYASLAPQIKEEEAQLKLMEFMSTAVHPHFLDDVVHFTTMHDNDLESVHAEVCSLWPRLGSCSLSECAMAGRHCEVEQERRVDGDGALSLDSKVQFWVDSLDQLHFYVLHAFEAGFRVKKVIKLEEKEEGAAMTLMDTAFARLKDEIHAKRVKWHRLFGRAEKALAKFNLSSIASTSEQHEQGGTFLDVVRRQLGMGHAEAHSLFLFLCAQRFDTEALCADLAELSRSNIAEHVGRQLAAAVKHCHAEWTRTFSPLCLYSLYTL